MKKFYSVLTMLTMMFVALVVTACGGDDDNQGGGSNVKNKDVVGTWKGYSCVDDDPNDLSTNHTLTLVFNADGTGTYDEYEVLDANKCSFSYSMEGNTKGKAYISSIGNSIYFMLGGGKMYVYDHGYGEDLDFVLSKQ